MFILTTENLNLRWANKNDAQFIYELVNDPDWITHIGDRQVHNHDDAINFINDSLLSSYKTNGYGLYVIENKIDNSPIGLCGLLKRQELSTIDIGYALLKRARQQGFAFEAAKAVLDYAMQQFNFSSILAITTPVNSASIKLLKKLNFQLIKQITLSNDSKPVNLFEKHLTQPTQRNS